MSEVENADSQGEVLPEGTGEVEEQEEATTSTEETTADKPKAKGVQKRLDELTANWRGEQRRSDELQKQNAELVKKLTAEPVKEAIETEPQLDDYSTYEEFVDAKAAYRAEKTVEAKFAEREAERVERERRETAASQQQQFEVRAQAFADTHDDFDAVARNPNLPVTQDMAELLNVSEKGPEILYHLGQNPDESYRIAQLPSAQAAMELGRIEAQLGVLQPNTQSGAPDPIEPLSQGQGAKAKDPENMSTSEWLNWRNAQLEAK